MMLKVVFIIAYWCATFTSTGTLTANIGNNKEALIPRQILFGPRDKTNASISHNGQYISYLAQKGCYCIYFIYTNSIIISGDKQNPLKYFNNLAEI